MLANPTIPIIPRATATPVVVATPAAPEEAVAGGRSRWWLLPWLGLFVWHGWLTLTLFGTDEPWLVILDDRPLTAGKHPLHLYHGSLGARSFLHNGDLCCYDPAFQAGYPKTPVYDSGSRPAELFLTLSAGKQPARAYKLGLAASCLLLPVSIAIAITGLGFNRRTMFLTTLLSLFIWWGDACQRLLIEGDLDLVLAAMMLVAQMGLLVRFDQRPGVLIWIGLTITGFLAWFAQPLCAVLLLPLFLLYFLHTGPRHSFLWHLALFSGLCLAVACNIFWLNDWLRYWWLRAPPVAGEWLVDHRTPRTLWESPLWGSPFDRGLTLFLLALAITGTILCYRNGQRATVRLLGLGTLGLFGLALGGLMNDMLARLQTPLLLLPALLLAAPLAAHAIEHGWQLTTRKLGFWMTCVVALPLGPLVYLLVQVCPECATRSESAQPLTCGWRDSQQEIVTAIRTHTTTEGRILWEATTEAGTWTALLPWLTGRSYIGGIDPNNSIEPSACQLRSGSLMGRAIGEWSDDELENYCRRYNIGWVAAWKPETIARLKRWRLAATTCDLLGEQRGVLYTIDRRLTFVLKGKARTFKADVGTVTLCDVIPEDGEIVLSLHYQAKITASPSRVRVEREIDSQDPIPLIRLRVDGPVARITLTFSD